MISAKDFVPLIIAIVIIGAAIITCCVIAPNQGEDTSNQTHLVVVDTDPGIDDSIALFMNAKLLGNPDVYVLTAGNVTMNILKRNLIGLCEYLDLDTVFAIGAENKMDGTNPYYDGFFGEDGLGNESDQLIKMVKEKYGVDINKILSQEEIDEFNDIYFEIHNVKELAEYLKKADSITYITLGPLTTLATLISEYPELKKKISNVYIMGGGFEITNAPHDAEFNLACDPDADKIVFSSGLDITLFPLDLTLGSFLSEDDIKKLEATEKYPEIISLLKYGMESSRKSGESTGFQMNDPVVVLYQSKPELFETEKRLVSIDEYGHIEESENGYPIQVATYLDPTVLKLYMEEIFSVNNSVQNTSKYPLFYQELP